MKAVTQPFGVWQGRPPGQVHGMVDYTGAVTIEKTAS
jgi:hypothetical protein